MSFKYRFILSFVSLEVFFILLIVSVNFFAMNSLSKQLANEKIESNISLFEELIKVPISVYDLATLDNLLSNYTDLKYVNSIIVLDSQNRVLSSVFNLKNKNIEEIIRLKSDEQLNYEDNNYEIKYAKIYDENIFLGSLYVIFDFTGSYNFIKQTQKNTFYLIFFEILISTILAYLIGIGLTKKLTTLSSIAKEIGSHKFIKIPYVKKKDEIGILSKSLNQMQVNLRKRSKKLEKLANKLEIQKTELLETQRYKDAFFANMSHELKTPLNSINILSSLMKKNNTGNLTQAQVKNMEIINYCGENLASLINDILDISKLEAKETILEVYEFDFDEYILEIRNMFESQIRAKNLTFNFMKNETIGVVKTDEKRLRQVIVNLLSNAIKFTEMGNIDLIIEDANEYISISVKDEGIGIPSDKLIHIFDRFKQVDSSISRRYGGTGLGLAISKELTNLLGGQISVQSELGKGSCFIIKVKKDIDFKSFKKLEDKQITLEKSIVNQKNDEKKEIFILNKEPANFINIFIELKRKNRNLSQVSNIEVLKEKISDKKDLIVIFDFDSLSEEEMLNFINKNKNFVFYVICKDKNIIKEEITKMVSYVFEKPLNKDEFILEISKI